MIALHKVLLENLEQTLCDRIGVRRGAVVRVQIKRIIRRMRIGVFNSVAHAIRGHITGQA